IASCCSGPAGEQRICKQEDFDPSTVRPCGEWPQPSHEDPKGIKQWVAMRKLPVFDSPVGSLRRFPLTLTLRDPRGCQLTDGVMKTPTGKQQRWHTPLNKCPRCRESACARFIFTMKWSC